MIDLISFDNLLKTLFLTLEIDKKELDYYIKYRKELREKRDEALTRKKENRINEKKNPTIKLVKTKANKYGLTRMR